ncbi:MAG: ABC transporter permease [Cytophagales bacterium]|nr:ABC transporter permease [Cytophagales bacterium]
MKTLIFLLEKEFHQIFRNAIILRMIILMPVIQLIVLPLAADFEIKDIKLVVVDQDRSSYARDLINKITSSGYFKLVDCIISTEQGLEYIESDEADVVLEVPPRFERDLIRERQQEVYLYINAINGTKANVGGAYLSQVIHDFNGEIRAEWRPLPSQRSSPKIEIVSNNWFNPLLNYRVFMVPGILVLLVTMIGSFMTALNIVKEKEVGTIEQINVTPIKRHHFVLGKLIPFWVIGMFVFSIGLLIVARFLYGIVPVGNLLLLYGYLALYLVAILGVGLLVSTYSQTQQQSMSLVFFIMMIFILMSGLFSSLESMPPWAQVMARVNPVTYFIEVMRMVVMKGSEFKHISSHFLVMIGFALLSNFWAVFNYRKTN